MARSRSISSREWLDAALSSCSSSPILIVISPTMRTTSSSSWVGTRVVALGSARVCVTTAAGAASASATGAASTRWRTVSLESLLRAASSISTMANALSGALSSPHTAATICSRQSAAAISAAERALEGWTASVSQISSTSSSRCASFATPMMPRMLAEPLRVCAARLALRSSSDCVKSAIHPDSESVTSAACGGESCMKASSRAASTSLEMLSARSPASSASGAADSLSSSAAPIERAAASSLRSSFSAESSSGNGTQPPPKCEISDSMGPLLSASRRCASTSWGQSAKKGRTSSRASWSSELMCSRFVSTQAAMRCTPARPM